MHVGSGLFPTPQARLSRPIGGQLCPDLPLLEDGSHLTIHLNEILLGRACWNQLNGLSKDQCLVAGCVGTACYRKLPLSARWNAQRVNETVHVAVQPPSIVMLIKPVHVYGTKSMTALSGWVGRRCLWKSFRLWTGIKLVAKLGQMWFTKSKKWVGKTSLAVCYPVERNAQTPGALFFARFASLNGGMGMRTTIHPPTRNRYLISNG